MPVQQAKGRKGRNRVSDLLAVILLLGVVAGVAWLWWQQKRSHKDSPKPPETVVLNTRKQPIVPSMAVVERKPEPAETKPEPVPRMAATPMVVSNPAALVPAVTSAPPVVAVTSPVTAPATSVPAVTPLPPAEFPRPAKNWLEGQIAMARHAISSGSIDGVIGSQTRAAFAAWQRARKLSPTRPLDTNSLGSLTLDAPLWTTYTVTTNDLARLQPLGKTWLAKSEQSALEYETILELVAEKAHAYPTLIQRLNPSVEWNRLAAGTVLKIPDVAYPEPDDKAAFVVIHLSEKYLEAFGSDSNLLAHFPCSIAAHVEKRPVGTLHVAVIAPHPNYTFDPAIFPESPEAQAIGHKLVLAPGPNNPVGVAWIGLDKTGYGMHGTPSPEQIGHTESHGCFRLANWDAEYLVKLAWVGMPVEVLP
ncbi:MAG TPA: L,D-transpeptidase family protein [Verrucomicrobiae bacterium]